MPIRKPYKKNSRRFRKGNGKPKHRRSRRNSFPPLCSQSKLDFAECELAILRQAVDENEKVVKTKIANGEEVKKMIAIVEDFLRSTKCICYGGTAINNILPEEAQFYDRNLEIPDYDFFSQTPVQHAKDLADIFYKEGYTEVEAKAGVHYGTYKVFVNFIPMADITMLHPQLYKGLFDEAIRIDGIHYTPANYLRMGMFLELSRPQGDVSRWEKVLKRLTLLNQYYPLKTNKCFQIDFQRSLDNSPEDSNRLYCIIRDTFIDQRVVFFGGYATSLYSQYMQKKQQRDVQSIPDFDVLSMNPDRCADIVLTRLREEGYTNAKVVKHEAVGEVIPVHYEILVGPDTLALIYEPLACHNYNELVIKKRTVRVATIDTILSFYLAFLYADMDYFAYYKDRLLCMSQYLFQVEQQNRLAQKGLLTRFTMKCYGVQPTLETIRAEKTKMFEKLRNRKTTDTEKEAWFLKYNPGGDVSKKAKTESEATTTTKKKSRKPNEHKKKVVGKKTRKKSSPKSEYFF